MREWPSKIVLYHLTGQVVHPTNGTVTKTYQRIAIRRALVLPVREVREFAYDLSYIAANKNFTYGGHFDTGRRRFLIDRDKLGGVVIERNDHFTYEQKRWDVEELSVSAELRFVAPMCKVIDGVPPTDVHPVSAGDTVEVTETDG